MQNCPITTSLSKTCFSTLPNSTAGGLFYCKTVREGTLPDYTTETLAGASNYFFVGEWVPNSMAGGLLLQDCTRALFTRLHGGDPVGEASNLVGEKMGGFCPHSLTTRLHGGRGKTTDSSDAGCCRILLHTLYKSRDPLIA
jgi:hypothetical protein